MLRRYLLLPVIIGILTGILAVIFIYLLELIDWLVLNRFVGYAQPSVAVDEAIKGFVFYSDRPYLLPITVAIGGLISGLITHYVSPECAGGGTDVAIKFYHRQKRLSIKTSLLKLITSAITIGTGGTSGKQGPIALIGAGVGSAVADLLRMGERERRIALAIGLGSGVAALFKAPLAGAIISAEIFFKRDFETEALIPSFIASIISYSIFGMFFGFQPLFTVSIPPLLNVQPANLLAYVGLGIFCSIVVRFYVFFFFSVKRFFDRLNIKPMLKPALGGLLAGSVGAFAPAAVGNGYGWLQLLLDERIESIGFILFSLLAVLLGVSFTLGSGISGGIFGPSVIIGGFTGALYSLILKNTNGFLLHVPSFVVVGMVSIFAGAAKAPLSTLILIVEMTGGYDLLVPAMISVSITYFLSGKETILPSQVDTRLDSPAYIHQWGILILEKLKVRDFMRVPVTINPHSSVEDAYRIMSDRFIGGLPVVEKERLIGIITRSDVLKVPPGERKKRRVKDVMTKDVITITPEDSLADALRLMTGLGIGRLPVVEKESNKIVGIIARADIGSAIREQRP